MERSVQMQQNITGYMEKLQFCRLVGKWVFFYNDDTGTVASLWGTKTEKYAVH